MGTHRAKTVGPIDKRNFNEFSVLQDECDVETSVDEGPEEAVEDHVTVFQRLKNTVRNEEEDID